MPKQEKQLAEKTAMEGGPTGAARQKKTGTAEAPDTEPATAPGTGKQPEQEAEPSAEQKPVAKPASKQGQKPSQGQARVPAKKQARVPVKTAGSALTADTISNHIEPIESTAVEAEPVQAEPARAEPVEAEPVEAEPDEIKPAQVNPLSAPTTRLASSRKLHKKAEKKAARLNVARDARPGVEPPAEVLSSEVAYEGPLFKVFKEQVREPNGHVTNRDVIRHNGSVVILAVDTSKSKKDPLIIMERQYRHAAGQYLWEIPAGKLEAGEDRLAGAKRELAEETGYQAKRWTELVRYFASPGFLGEWMQVFLAEGLTAGTATPEDDETLQVFALPLSQVEALIDAGKILDGKTLVGVSLYKRLRKKRKKQGK